MPLLRGRRNLQCFYCGKKSRSDQASLPRTWSCPHCEATNNVDEFGQPVSPDVAQVTTERPQVRYAQRPNSPPIMPTPAQPFCDECLRNQLIVREALAEYIPEPEDPQYQLFLDSADDRKRELEETYPQVCEDCAPQVQAQIANAGYAAHADNLRHILARSEENRLRLFTRRQNWLLRLIFTAKWAYILSTLVGIVWHATGIIAEPTTMESTAFVGEGDMFSLATCIKQALRDRAVNSRCFESEPILNVVSWALIADAVTFWWNPKLGRKMNSQKARMRGTTSLWFCRLLVSSFRTASYMYPRGPPLGRDTLLSFHVWHGIVLGLIIVVTVMSWNVVRLEYPSLRSSKRPLEPLTTQRVASKSPRKNKPARPTPTVFDTMGHSFTQSFNADFASDGAMTLDGPPSPTESITTKASLYSDVFTPRKKSVPLDDDAMDWTPTHLRFGQQQTTTHPNPFGNATPTQPDPPPRQPHSIFAQRDPNPFAHKVPAFPKGPQAQKRDPWIQGVSNSAQLQTVKKSLLDDVIRRGERLTQEEREQAMENNVPRNVKKSAELFKEPQFKYDYQGYTEEKTTGLEDTFNDLFSR